MFCRITAYIYFATKFDSELQHRPSDMRGVAPPPLSIKMWQSSGQKSTKIVKSTFYYQRFIYDILNTFLKWTFLPNCLQKNFGKNANYAIKWKPYLFGTFLCKIVQKILRGDPIGAVPPNVLKWDFRLIFNQSISIWVPKCSYFKCYSKSALHFDVTWLF